MFYTVQILISLKNIAELTKKYVALFEKPYMKKISTKQDKKNSSDYIQHVIKNKIQMLVVSMKCQYGAVNINKACFSK